MNEWKKDIEAIWESFTEYMPDAVSSISHTDQPPIVDPGLKSRIPANRRQINKARAAMSKLRQRYPVDELLASELSELKSRLRASTGWVYNGPTWSAIILFLILAAIFYFMGLQAYLRTYDLETAEQYQSTAIKRIDRGVEKRVQMIPRVTADLEANAAKVADLESREQTKQNLDQTAYWKTYGLSIGNTLDETRREISDLRLKRDEIDGMSVEQYAARLEANADELGKEGMREWGPHMIWLGLFILFSFTPFFVANRRAGRNRSDIRFVRMIQSTFDAVLNIEPQEVIFHDGYGHKQAQKDETTGLIAFFIVPCLVMFVLAAVVLALPVLVAIALVRNVILPLVY